jgi:hypothetical protein
MGDQLMLSKSRIGRARLREGAIAAALCATAILASTAVVGPVKAQSPVGALSDAMDVNGATGVVAEIMQCKREGGVLSIRMRLRNTGSEDTSVTLVGGGNYDQYYVTAGGRKYLVLRDAEKMPLASPINHRAGEPAFAGVVANLPKGGSYTWYAKYPAPPIDVKKIIYYTPITVPFEDIPVSD